MTKSLNNDDLKAIKLIVDEATEDSDQRTAAGFAEVHAKIDEVDARLGVKIDEVDARLGVKIDEVDARLGSKIDEVDNKLSVKDGKLENTVQRVDEHDAQLGKIKRKLNFVK